jgi:predicted dinucleotide-binding enzyme
MSNVKPRIGIIGAGRLGTAIAAQALKAGYEVRIANSRSPESLRLQLSVLLPGAIGSSIEDTIVSSDIIVLAIPLNAYRNLPKDLFSGKIVVDAMNYWPPTEGILPEFEDSSSSEYIQKYLADAKVVKSLNHVAYNELEQHSLSHASPNRRVILLAGNDQKAKEQVSQFVDAIGFDPVDLGLIRTGKKFQPDTKLFNLRYNKKELKTFLDND